MALRHVPDARRYIQYAPALATILNVDAIELLDAFAIGHGDLVEVLLSFRVTPSLADDQFLFSAELPLPIEVTDRGEISGVGGLVSGGSTIGFGVSVFGRVGTQLAEIAGASAAGGSPIDGGCSFAYRVIR